jgi:hypothetical protein
MVERNAQEAVAAEHCQRKRDDWVDARPAKALSAFEPVRWIA